MSEPTGPACRYVANDLPRFLIGRHEDGCPGDCEGCQECSETHCRLCYDEHIPEAHQTCPTCVNAVRSDLNAIPDLVDQLEDQAVNGAPDGRPLAMAAIPGGDAMVLMGAGSDGVSSIREVTSWRDIHAADHERVGDPEPPLSLLASWEDDWRNVFGFRHGPRATIQGCVAWLTEHLHTAAQTHDAFDEFAQQVAGCRSRLESVLGHGTGDQKGAACIWCQATLVRRARERKERDQCDGHADTFGGRSCTYPRQSGCCDRGGVDLDGEWHCPRCRRRYDPERYDRATKAAYIFHAEELSAPEMAARFSIPAGTIRVWANRGLVRKRRRPGSVTLYSVADVAARVPDVA